MIFKLTKRGICIWECDVCKKHFDVSGGRAREHIKKGSVKMCSAECLSRHRKSTCSTVMKKWTKENKGKNVKVGCGITTDGYVWIYMNGRNGRANQIKLHRYLMEIKIGRKLNKKEIVHHIDENKLNNDISNLQIVSISEHNRIHGHFKKENRDDCWNEEEIKFTIKNPTYDEYVKKFGNKRTMFAFATKKSKLLKKYRYYKILNDFLKQDPD